MKKTMTTVTMLRSDVKRLKQYQVHPSQPYWEVIKLILDKKAAEALEEKQ